MPVELVQCGPRFLKGDTTVTPMASDRRCEACGSPAPFGITKTGKTLAYCGFIGGESCCKRIPSHPSNNTKAA